MAQTYPIAQPNTIMTFTKAPAVSGLIALLLLAAITFFAIRQLDPPAAVPATAPPTEFSSGRALKYVEALAQRPHPIGSAEHAAARAAVVSGLTSVGLMPEVQTATVVSQRRGSPYYAATVHNVIAQLKGTEPGKALMLTAHYDSVTTGPGASDDAAAVGALIETARALKTGPPLKNDVIFLITDAEETGLLGAKAFADEHPLAKQVGLVLNFEARGNSGPAVLFETSGRNGRLIEEFAKAAPHPVANSFAYEVYKQLPNDTDFSIFKDAGLTGLNFAYFQGLTQYHTQLDAVTRLDERSLQHHGSYALALARHFGNVKLDDLRGAGDATYFNVPGLAFVRYPGGLSLLLTGLTALVFAGVVVLGFRRKQLTVRGVLGGFLGFVVGVVLAAVVYTVVWKVRRIVHNGLGFAPQADIYNAKTYLVSIIALATALAAALYLLYRRRTSAQNLMVGGALGWLLLLGLVTLSVPGANYLLAWPLLFSLLALGYFFATGGFTKGAVVPLVVAFAGVLPAILLLTPTIYLIFNALVMNSLLWISIFTVLMFWLFIPQVELLTARRRWVLPLAALALALGAMVVGGYASRFDAQKPQETHLFYALNANTGAAIWASADDRPNEWTKQYLTDNPKRGEIADYVPTRFNRFLSSPAPAAPLPGPEVQLLDVQTKPTGTRVARLRVTSPRHAPILSLVAEPGTDVLQTTIDGKWDTTGKLPPRAEGRDWGFNYYAFPEEGVEVTIEVASKGPIKLRALDQTYGLPALPGQTYAARPTNLMPLSFYFSDNTLVGKTFTF